MSFWLFGIFIWHLAIKLCFICLRLASFKAFSVASQLDEKHLFIFLSYVWWGKKQDKWLSSHLMAVKLFAAFLLAILFT